jgi:hypothetical protein
MVKRKKAMSKKKSEFLSALGIMWQVWKSLTDEILAFGGNDEAIRLIETDSDLRRQMAELVVAKMRSVERIAIKPVEEIIPIKHVIDCDVDPFIPKNWRVKEHIKGGQLEWDPSQIELYLDEGQKDGKSIVGNKLLKKLTGKKVMNACVLDYLLDHPELIPEKWKSKAVFFWGTIYRSSDNGSLCVRYLYWHGGRWYWRFGWFNDGFLDVCPAAVRK